MFDESKFKNKRELQKFLKENHDSLMKMKMESFKKADSVMFSGPQNYMLNKELSSFKSNEPIQNPGNELNISAVINSTNWLDSHMDVHIPGLWKKSLSENKFIKFLQEHRMAFDKIIADKEDLKAMAKKITWKELGQDYPGVSECLVFDAKVKISRNEFMFNQYANGHVDNHSVGMRYVKMVMCIDNEADGAYFEAWEKYFPQIINPENAEKKGYFWAITEAKVIEGSAVPIGSNVVTPTLNNNNKFEPGAPTQDIEPSKRHSINYDELISNLNF